VFFANKMDRTGANFFSEGHDQSRIAEAKAAPIPASDRAKGNAQGIIDLVLRKRIYTMTSALTSVEGDIPAECTKESRTLARTIDMKRGPKPMHEPD